MGSKETLDKNIYLNSEKTNERLFLNLGNVDKIKIIIINWNIEKNLLFITPRNWCSYTSFWFSIISQYIVKKG